MPFTDRTLWVVNYGDIDLFIAQAIAAKVKAVAVRTDNDGDKAVAKGHAAGLKVFGWRWPSARRDAALHEAQRASQLLANGLDGYYIDPEGEKGQPYDWDQVGLDGLAKDFCETVLSVDNKIFGITSHYRGKNVFGKLPWSVFFQYATVFLPQAYWRSDAGVIGHGEPTGNYIDAVNAWEQTGAPRTQIVPMAGEIAHVTKDEIAEYSRVAAARGITTGHFYASENGISDDVWAAIAQS